MIRIDFEKNESPDDGREWLETDGEGGYASSTLENRHTRRYHGLFVPNLKQPEGRHVLLSKLEDSLAADGKEFFFSSHRYPGVLFPPGPPVLQEFSLDLYPGFAYRAGRAIVKKSILMPRGKGVVLVRYDVERCQGGVLRLKPFLAFRGYHDLARENPFLRDRAEDIENGFRIEPYDGMPPLFLQTSRFSHFTPSPAWYNRFQYTEEAKRGFDCEEDLFLPGILEVPLERKMQHRGCPAGPRSDSRQKTGQRIRGRGSGSCSHAALRRPFISHHHSVGKTGHHRRISLVR